MTVSGIFSYVIYRFVSMEIERGFSRVEERIRADRPNLLPPQDKKIFFQIEYEEAKKIVRLRLLYLNGIIALIAASGAYYFASKTLQPIEDAYDEQQRFVADASHELKTPITAIKTNIEVTLRDKNLSLKSAKNALIESLEDISNLQMLTLTLLNLTRYQRRNNDIILEQVDLQEVVAVAVKKLAPFAKKKDIKMDVKIEPLVFEGDSEAVSKLITILLDNSLKYTQMGGKVDIVAKKVRKNLVIEVRDNGMGISQIDLPHIFDRFYRADQSRCKQKIPGYGLGLSMAKNITDLHKGSIDVESNIGKGTVFTIKLPLHT